MGNTLLIKNTNNVINTESALSNYLNSLFIMVACMVCFSCRTQPCCSKIWETSSGKDTSDILSTILTSGKIKEDMYIIPDSIYFIKSKNGLYNSSWPTKIKQIKIGYLKETSVNVKRLERSERITDKPLRYIVTSFNISNDSSHLVVYGINQLTDYTYHLRKVNNTWKIVEFTYKME